VGEEEAVEMLMRIGRTGFDREEALALFRGLEEIEDGSEAFLVGWISQLQYRRGRPPAEVMVDLQEHWPRDRR
jgi:hypothetical protein